MIKRESVSKIIKTMNTCDLATEVREHILEKFKNCQQNQFAFYNSTDEEMKLRNLVHRKNFKLYINSKAIEYKKANFTNFEKQVILNNSAEKNTLSDIYNNLDPKSIHSHSKSTNLSKDITSSFYSPSRKLSQPSEIQNTQWDYEEVKDLEKWEKKVRDKNIPKLIINRASIGDFDDGGSQIDYLGIMQTPSSTSIQNLSPNIPSNKRKSLIGMHIEEPDRNGIKSRFSSASNTKTPKQYHEDVVIFEESILTKIKNYEKKLSFIAKKLLNLRKENTKLNENISIIKTLVEPQLGKKLNLKSAIEANSNMMVRIFSKKQSVTVIQTESETNIPAIEEELESVMNSPSIHSRARSPTKKVRKTVLLSMFGNNTTRGSTKALTQNKLETSNLVYQEMKDKIRLFVVYKNQVDGNSRTIKRLQDETIYYKEKIRIARKEKVIFFKCILKTGIDVRSKGIVWILIQLYKEGEDINRPKIKKFGFPEILDESSVTFLYQRFEIEINLAEKNSIYKSLFDVYLAKNPDFKSICLPLTYSKNRRFSISRNGSGSFQNFNENEQYHKKSKVL